MLGVPTADQKLRHTQGSAGAGSDGRGTNGALLATAVLAGALACGVTVAVAVVQLVKARLVTAASPYGAAAEVAPLQPVHWRQASAALETLNSGTVVLARGSLGGALGALESRVAPLQQQLQPQHQQYRDRRSDRRRQRREQEMGMAAFPSAAQAGDAGMSGQLQLQASRDDASAAARRLEERVSELAKREQLAGVSDGKAAQRFFA